MQELATAFQMIYAAISSIKKLNELLPRSKEEKETLEGQLIQAERQTLLAEAQIAQALDYSLCRCTFPPQIMLRVGDDERCPRCHDSLMRRAGRVTVKKDFDPRV